MNRATGVALLAGALASLVILAALGAGRGWLRRDTLRAACEDLRPGDPLIDAYRALGRPGYRPGCGAVLPCQEVVIDGRAWPLSCTEDDCDQLWTDGRVRCALDFDPASRTLRGATASRVPEGL